jgi:hypothetical protein
MAHTIPNFARNFLSLLPMLPLAAAGCLNHVEDAHPESIAEHGAVFAAEDEGLLEELMDGEDGFSLTPIFVAEEENVSRVAFRFDAATAFTVQVRFSLDDAATFSEWIDAEVTFNEDAAHNAHIDVPTGITHAQLRFLAPVDAGLRFLAVEMFAYEPVVEEEAPEIDVTSSVAEQGLAADGIVVTRSQWGARSRSCGPSQRPNRITVHHTVTPNNDSMSMPARMRQIQSFHINSRGWCDIGYHFLIGQDGRVYQGRMENVIGAHAANANANNAGVSFIGTFTSVAPSEAMMNAGARIIKALSRTYGIALTRDKVKGHRQVGTTATSCPGNTLYSRLDNLLTRARGTTVGGSSGSTSSGFCGENGGRTGTWCRGADVVVCDGGRQVSRTTCQHGCQTMPQGTPDRCQAPPASQPTGFGDVGSTHWARNYINAVVSRGAMSGCGNGNFCPSRNVTKAQLAHAIAVLKAGNVDLTGVPSFNDVPTAHRASAREVVGRGIMQACAGGGFCGGDPVTRAAGAVYMRRTMNLSPLDRATPTFGDVARSHWAYSAIERIKADGIASGCSTSPMRFCPSDNLTRAQAAAFLARTFDLR